MRKQRRRDRGFVLLWTLALLMLASVVMLDLTRRSARSAVQAVQAQDELQRRWAMISCRKAMLRQAEAMLARAEEKKHTTVTAASASQQLGEWQLEVVVSDEQAKANINSLYAALGARRTIPVVQRLAAAVSVFAQLNLRPDPRAAIDSDSTNEGEPSAPQSGPPPFSCWEQIVESSDPNRTREQADALARGLTLWGDGRLNVRRATPESIRLFLEPHASSIQIARLLQARQERPNEKLEQWMAALELTPEESAAMGQWLTDQSSCYSVRITARNGQRTYSEWAAIGPPFVYHDASEPTTQPASQPATPSPIEAQVHRIIW